MYSPFLSRDRVNLILNLSSLITKILYKGFFIVYKNLHSKIFILYNPINTYWQLLLFRSTGVEQHPSNNIESQYCCCTSLSWSYTGMWLKPILLVLYVVPVSADSVPPRVSITTNTKAGSVCCGSSVMAFFLI